MDPGTYIAVAEIAFRTASFAVRTFRNGLNFSKDAEQLVLRFELERFRLQLWGENSGLVPLPGSGERPKLPPRLEPLCEVLKNQLEEIAGLFCQHGTLSDRYGLARTEEAPTKSERVADLVLRMQKSFLPRRTSLVKDEDEDEDVDVEEIETSLQRLGTGASSKSSSGPVKMTTSAWKKIRWSILDLKRFEALVSNLSSRVSALNQLLTEASQQRKAQENDSRINIVLVGSAVDQESLNLLRAAVSGYPDTSPARLVVERKAISADVPWLPPMPALPPAPSQRRGLRLADFNLPRAYEAGTAPARFLTTRKAAAQGDDGNLFLFEKKVYDRGIKPDDKRKLTERIQRLVLLLSKPKGPTFMTLAAEGCIQDPEHYCWWLVFRYPSPLLPSPTSLPGHVTQTPVSLATLLDPRTKFRPPLEQRYMLASRVAGTFSELFSSSWLHKGIRSDNVAFPALAFSSTADYGDQLSRVGGGGGGTNAVMSSLAVCGFDYSRQESEAATIDQARSSGDVATAMYRHPRYQGAAAQGYRLEYDLYSLGLVLLEIALWRPLSSFLEGKPAGGAAAQKAAKSSIFAAAAAAVGGGGGGDGAGEVRLSRDMRLFHRPHALLLRKMVLRHVDSELAFRVGSPYHRAVVYCLKAADVYDDANGDVKALCDEEDLASHPALEFYNQVVVPLARLSAATVESG
ncbi:hypothetical protein PpBr36_08941 [Pyricularia pennisetigena]|uniref:hypothetical protein n=1 Tax=Pyricularia pennisetigena TaxID=1578925 RepID=UPI0011538C9E|nr:hypothetical protein PpBr36_08941 [Pyricularia pennisetigena]TLS24362.1 hypothetical protein PpBr36_08941 [Pyricularia pennisetigena]